MQVPADLSANAPPHGLLPISTTPISTQRLAQKDPSRKPRVGPNIPEDLTKPVREGRRQGRVRKMFHGQARLLLCGQGKEKGRRKQKKGTGCGEMSTLKLLTSKKISSKLPVHYLQCGSRLLHSHRSLLKGAWSHVDSCIRFIGKISVLEGTGNKRITLQEFLSLLLPTPSDFCSYFVQLVAVN